MDSLKSDEDVQKLTAEVQAAYEQAEKDDPACNSVFEWTR